MATESNLTILSFIAGASLATSQYLAVKLSADDTVVVCTAVTDKPIGVLQNKPASGGTAEVAVAGKTKWISDAALNAGDLVGTSADGQADAKVPGSDPTEYVLGTVLVGTGAAGGYAEVLISTPAHRAA